MKKEHQCSTCGRRYSCCRPGCGSPYLFECFSCYLARCGEEIEAALNRVAQRLKANTAEKRAAQALTAVQCA